MLLLIVIKSFLLMLLGHMFLVTLTVKKLLKRFIKKNCKKTNQEKFRIEKLIKRKGDKLFFKWKGYIFLSVITLIKKILFHETNFLEPYTHRNNKVKTCNSSIFQRWVTKCLNISTNFKTLNTFTLPSGLTETIIAWQSKGFSND